MEARVPVAPGFDEVWSLIRVAVIENSRVNHMVQRTHKCLLTLKGYSWFMIRSYCKCRANADDGIVGFLRLKPILFHRLR